MDPKPDDVEIPDDVEWADLSADQRWHYRHVETNRDRTLTRRAKNRAWLYEYKHLECECERCGEETPACLDFHHPDDVEKEMEVGKMVTYGYSRDRIRGEIEKCIVLCANCHRKEHYQIPDGVELRKG